MCAGYRLGSLLRGAVRGADPPWRGRRHAWVHTRSRRGGGGGVAADGAGGVWCVGWANGGHHDHRAGGRRRGRARACPMRPRQRDAEPARPADRRQRPAPLPGEHPGPAPERGPGVPVDLRPAAGRCARPGRQPGRCARAGSVRQVLREHGFPGFPDPQADGSFRASDLPQGVKPGNPPFDAALRACRQVNPDPSSTRVLARGPACGSCCLLGSPRKRRRDDQRADRR